MPAETVPFEFLGIRFDTFRFDAVLDGLLARPRAAAFAYVVTPNVDHIVRLHDQRQADRARMLQAYEGAGWRLCDSRILARLARCDGRELPVVTGSDLTREVLALAAPGTSIAIVGGSEDLVPQLRSRYPTLRFRQHQPPMGLRYNVAALDAAARFVAEAGADFTILAVGSPQQELLAQAVASRGDARGVGLCVGAALDFIIGAERRAPRLLQKLGLEWLFRLAGNPRRMWRRYLIEGPRIFLIWWRGRTR